HIVVRVLTLDPKERIDGGFFRRRLEDALGLRRSFLDLRDTDSFRLVHGEADGLPGVVVDLFAGFAVLKLYSAGLTSFRPLIVDALSATVPDLRGIVGRDEVNGEEADAASVPAGKLWGDLPPERLLIRERAVVFWVDLYRGQKTGFFLDQRENRALIR